VCLFYPTLLFPVCHSSWFIPDIYSVYGVISNHYCHCESLPDLCVKDFYLFIVVLLLFPAFEMTLAEGTRFERRFFHQTFATVSFVVTSVNKTNKIEL